MILQHVKIKSLKFNGEIIIDVSLKGLHVLINYWHIQLTHLINCLYIFIYLILSLSFLHRNPQKDLKYPQEFPKNKLFPPKYIKGQNMTNYYYKSESEHHDVVTWTQRAAAARRTWIFIEPVLISSLTGVFVDCSWKWQHQREETEAAASWNNTGEINVHGGGPVSILCSTHANEAFSLLWSLIFRWCVGVCVIWLNHLIVKENDWKLPPGDIPVPPSSTPSCWCGDLLLIATSCCEVTAGQSCCVVRRVWMASFLLFVFFCLLAGAARRLSRDRSELSLKEGPCGSRSHLKTITADRTFSDHLQENSWTRTTAILNVHGHPSLNGRPWHSSWPSLDRSSVVTRLLNTCGTRSILASGPIHDHRAVLEICEMIFGLNLFLQLYSTGRGSIFNVLGDFTVLGCGCQGKRWWSWGLGGSIHPSLQL